MTRADPTKRLRFARHGWAGVALVLICWPANWLLPGVRTHLLFMPMWLGFALTVDALVLRRTGTSIITRSRRDFLLLFAVSAPFWWLFELINLRTDNWIYIGKEGFSDLQYFLLASFSFCTVVPAVFEAAELVRSTKAVSGLRSWKALRATIRLRGVFIALGLISLVLIVVWPRVFYPLVWGLVFFFVEPINQWFGRPSLFRFLKDGNWRPVASLSAGALLCGLFWELWNYYSFPKWAYDTPGVDFLHVFEMPLLGYLGYLPFGLELYALTSLALGREIISWDRDRPQH